MLKEILEGIVSKYDKDELKTVQEILDIIKSEKLFNYPVLYRGFSGTSQTFSEITNDRSSFYGSLNPNASKFVKDYLKIKSPTFATKDSTQASMFGEVHIFLPKPKDEIYYSSFYRDIMADLGFDDKSEESLQGVADSYKVTTIKGVKNNFKYECLVSSKKYYLINWRHFLSTFKSKFFDPERDINKLIWQDVYDALEAYLSRVNWEIKNNKRKSFDDEKVWQAEQIELHNENKAQKLSFENTNKRLNKIKQDSDNHLIPIIIEINKVKDKTYITKYNKKGEVYELIFSSNVNTKKFRKYYSKLKAPGGRELSPLDIDYFLTTKNKKVILR